MELIELIKTRRSIRRFKKKQISSGMVKKILEAGSWAPSGLNNQPWRFKIMEGKDKDTIARFTRYSAIVKSADKLILVFLDNNASYDRDKDFMAIGACVENMLLFIHSQKLGACWLGEVLKRKKEVADFVKVPRACELTAVIALGYPLSHIKRSRRRKVDEIIIA